MAVMTGGQRQVSHRQFMSDLSDDLSPTGALLKSELRTAINDTDDWLDTNWTAYEASLSTNIRTILTTAQKVRLLSHTARRRHKLGV